jgi:hypothetical protein
MGAMISSNNFVFWNVMTSFSYPMVKGKEYKYLVEGYRDQDGKVRQRTIKYLGAVSPSNGGQFMVATPAPKISFEEYLNYDDDTNKLYELESEKKWGR